VSADSERVTVNRLKRLETQMSERVAVGGRDGRGKERRGAQLVARWMGKEREKEQKRRPGQALD
jgi:hypothetical protein